VAELTIRLAARVRLAHPPPALVQVELERKFFLVTVEVRVLGRMPGAADDAERVELDDLAVLNHEGPSTPRAH